MKKLIIVVFPLLSITYLFGQKIKYTKQILHKMEQAEIDIFEPAEGKYTSKRPRKNNYQKIDHQIYSKEDKLEIRYTIIPYDENNSSTQVPHVEFMRVISSIAPNEEDTPITVHTMPSIDLSKHFNADWGSIAYFKPKPSFADYKHCRFLSIYGDKRGTIHIFFLFNEPSPILDSRFYAMRFKKSI